MSNFRFEILKLRAEGVHASEFIQSVEQPRFHGSEGAAQGRGYSGERIINVETKVNDLLMFHRQHSYAPMDQGGLFAKLDGLVRQRRPISYQVYAILNLLMVAPGEPGKRHRTFLAQRVAVTIEQNRTEPGEELAAAIVAAEAPPGFHQGILSQISGQGFIAAQREGLAQQPCFVSTANFTEGFGITRLGLGEETSRLWGWDFHEGWIQAEHISNIHAYLPGAMP